MAMRGAVSALFDKLNLGNRTEVLVIDAPSNFEGELQELDGAAIVHRDPRKVKTVDFVLAFVTRQRTLDATARLVAKSTEGDAVVWFAYPKGSSRNYDCRFNRDRGWAEMGKAGFESVRIVAIDDDWSALRFRRVEFIRTMKRDRKRTLTKAGKKRVAGK